MSSQTRGKSGTRNYSPTHEKIIINDKETPPSLDNVTLLKTLKDLLDDEIKLAIETQFTALQNLFTQQMENTMNQKRKTLANVINFFLNRTIDLIGKAAPGSELM